MFSSLVFVWWKIISWIKYLPGDQKLYHDVCPLYACKFWCDQWDVCERGYLYDFCVGFAAFSISSENSQVVMIAISAAVAIILLTVVVYVLIGRWVWCLILSYFVTFCPVSMSQRGPNDRGWWCDWFLILCLLPRSSKLCSQSVMSPLTLAAQIVQQLLKNAINTFSGNCKIKL